MSNSIYRHKPICEDLKTAAQPGNFERFTGDDKESREIRKEQAATENVTSDREWVRALVAHQLG